MAAWIDVPSVKKFVRWDDNFAGDDTVLVGVIASACQMIEDVKGRIGSATITGEDHEYTGRRIILDESPVVTVTSVVRLNGDGTTTEIPQGDPLAGVDGFAVTPGGILSLPDSVSCGVTVRVVYTVGLSPIPPNYTDAAFELTRHLWDNSQFRAGKSAPPPPYAWPIAVRERLGIFGKDVPPAEVLIG